MTVDVFDTDNIGTNNIPVAGLVEISFSVS